MVDQTLGLTCGGYTYELEYQSSGPLWDAVNNVGPSLAHYTLGACPGASATCDYTGSTNNMSWIGTHPFKIKGTNGTFGAMSTRGTNGLYNTIDSLDFTVTFGDACDISTVNSDGGLSLNDMSNRVFEQTVDVETYSGPKDSASITYGNGYDACGERTYGITDASGNLITAEYISVSSTSNTPGGTADNLTFRVQTDQRRYVGTHDIYLRVGLKEHPLATPALLPFKVTIYECILTSFIAPEPTDMEYVVSGKRKTKSWQQFE